MPADYHGVSVGSLFTRRLHSFLSRTKVVTFWKFGSCLCVDSFDLVFPTFQKYTGVSSFLDPMYSYSICVQHHIPKVLLLLRSTLLRVQEIILVWFVFSLSFSFIFKITNPSTNISLTWRSSPLQVKRLYYVTCSGKTGNKLEVTSGWFCIYYKSALPGIYDQW